MNDEWWKKTHALICELELCAMRTNHDLSGPEEDAELDLARDQLMNHLRRVIP